ncbi:hypothetical protein V6N11_050205 [Hibiscus sabdariffa]|uniref:Uncharacterized protein n=1 Tax=Hibiscus sabdariffa TaxID=183260 RepID=A0ABR2T9K8_9ROSI
MTGYRINVGEILAKELASACANDKGIPYLVSALCRRAAVPTSQGDKFQPEKTGWTKATYMQKMDAANATPLNMVMPTPPVSPIHTTAAPTNESPAIPLLPALPPPPKLESAAEKEHQTHHWDLHPAHHPHHQPLPSLKRQLLHSISYSCEVSCSA